MNGKEATRNKATELVIEPFSHPLSQAQQKHLLRLVSALGRAQEAQKAATEAAEVAQGNANDFLVFCAEEAGIVMGEGGWRFDQGRLRFVREEGAGDALDNS